MPPLPGDGRILEGFGLEDLDETSIAEYRDRFAETKPKHPWLALDARALLEQLGCWRKDRHTGNYGLTLAGVLMFGTHEEAHGRIGYFQTEHGKLISFSSSSAAGLN